MRRYNTLRDGDKWEKMDPLLRLIDPQIGVRAIPTRPIEDCMQFSVFKEFEIVLHLNEKTSVETDKGCPIITPSIT